MTEKTGHPISFDDFSILPSSNSQFNVLLHESLLIVKINPFLNTIFKNLLAYTIANAAIWLATLLAIYSWIDIQ